MLSLQVQSLSSMLQIRTGRHCDALHIQHHRGTIGCLSCLDRVVYWLCVDIMVTVNMQTCMKYWRRSLTENTRSSSSWASKRPSSLAPKPSFLSSTYNIKSSSSSPQHYQSHYHHHYRCYHYNIVYHYQHHMRPASGTTSFWNHCIWRHWWMLTSL